MSLEELSKQVQEMALALKSAQDENHHYRQELKAAKDEVDRLVRGERERSTETAHSPPAHPSHNQVIYVSQNRRVERFRDRPRNQSEQGILDWIADVKSHLAGRKLSTDEQAAYILDHLAGKARLEIQGRGPEVSSDPNQIFNVLTRIFGDGESIGQLWTRFFKYEQRPGDDLLTCSLDLLLLYQQIEALDQSCQLSRDRMLKERFADAVRDESLRRELRRLGTEQPSLSFFDARDRAIEWLGNRSASKKDRVEVSSHGIQGDVALKKMIEENQRIMQELVHVLKSSPARPSAPMRRERACWECGSPDHIRSTCPQLKAKKDASATTPPTQSQEN